MLIAKLIIAVKLFSENTPTWMFDWILNMLRVLNIPGFWIHQGFEYSRVTQGSEHAWIFLNNSWIYLIMPQYAWLFVNMLTSAWLDFVSHIPIVISCLLEREVTYFNYSHQKQKNWKFVSCDYVSLKKFAKLTGKHLCQSLFFDEIACLMPATLLERRIRHR